MTTFTWNINNLTAYPQLSGYDDVIFKVYWSLTGTETVDLSVYTGIPSIKTYSAVSNGEVDLYPLNLQNFTPYQDLTQDQVLGWILPSLDVPALTANLQRLIDEQKDPTEINLPPPWNNSAPTTTTVEPTTTPEPTTTTVEPTTTPEPVPTTTVEPTTTLPPN
jgi:hypothetical protein